MFHFSVRSCRYVATALTATGLCLFACSDARAQVVYSSLVNTTVTGADLQPTPTGGDPVRFATDDYVTTLAGPSGTFSTFQLGTLTFVGGANFTGAANGTNNVLRFRFLNEFGGITPTTTYTQFAFAASGVQTYTLNFGGLAVPTRGFIEVTTLPNSNANGTFAFSNSAPTVGTNSPTGGAPSGGVRAFALNVAAAPEPGSLALLGVGVMGMVGIIARRRETRGFCGKA